MKRIGLFVFQDCSMATTGAIGDAFRLANEFANANGDEPPYRFSVLSDAGGLVNSSSGISIWTQRLQRYSLADFHAFFVACRDVTEAAEANDRFLSWISLQGSIASFGIQHGANLAVVCRDPLQSTVPIFLFDDSNGSARTNSSATPTELAVAQIERDLNSDIARRIARILQTGYVEQNKPELDDASITTTTDKIRESARWIRENYSKAISVAQAAESAAMSKRNFQRRFKCEFGMTPLEYLLRTRFEVVSSMLKNTDLPVDKIARRCGMGDGNRLGRLFKERYGMSPTQFRAQQRIESEDRWPTPEESLSAATETLRETP
ncbi:Transcriptional regulator, AraC family [Paraburkholderia ribeironis]|uniref:Transcriptional regulator, AraC family n=1 Tax=Paraburkholderia ribeironis TaxID=1247936 RepID=A0A1N7SAB7_9BURK|nr:helix-turn-helix domain-containing protein [Paraburkholderia ribeironis]SIT43928.1 Transcriptional regulator, AraC family [Paraburkholderia ribeironis]